MTTLLTATYPYQGRDLTIVQLNKQFRLPLATLHRRLVTEGMTVDEALTKPFVRPKILEPHTHVRRHFFRGRRLSLTGWAKETGIAPRILRARMEAGWSLEKALTTPVEPQPRQRAGVKKRLIGYAGRE